MKVYGYCRVSTFEQGNDGRSLDVQRQQITGYAMMKGWQVAKCFVDAGVSGSVPLADRPEGQRLLAELSRGDVVVTAKLDRAFRSAADALGTLEQMKEDGVGLHMIDLGGDVCGNGISKLVFTILSAVAENERDRIRERVREAKRHRAAQQLYNGGRRPFGFDVVGEGKERSLVPNEPEQRALRHAQAMRKAGATLRAIAAELAQDYGIAKLDPKTLQRMLNREGASS
jgi:putative DNA-invertase from lambdoid prophage Rac